MNAFVLGEPRRRRGIGLTALIDVVFILLMFFMLTSSFTRWRAVALDVPTAGVTSESNTPEFLMLGNDGSLRIYGSDFLLAHFSQLNAGHSRFFSPSKPVVVMSDPEATVQSIVGALERLKTLGVTVTLGGVFPPAKATQTH